MFLLLKTDLVEFQLIQVREHEICVFICFLFFLFLKHQVSAISGVSRMVNLRCSVIVRAAIQGFLYRYIFLFRTGL